MEPVNILDARNNLSQLVNAATAGDDVVIAKRGRPVVRLVPIAPPAATGEAIARWLVQHPVPPHAQRSTDEIDAHIVEEREGWD